MAAQKREPGKNCIGLLSDDSEEPHSLYVPSAAGRGVRKYVFGLMAAIFDHGGDARSLPSPRRDSIASLGLRPGNSGPGFGQVQDTAIRSYAGREAAAEPCSGP